MTEQTKDKERVWVSSWLVPFAARLVVERYTCAAIFGGLKATGEATTKEWVRIVNNDRVIPIQNCTIRAQAGTGLCRLDAFVQGLEYVKSGAADDWAKCQDVV